MIKAATFSVSVNGTVVCTDTQTFAYNNVAGNCTDAGGGIVSAAGTFVNYSTGDYQITFTSGHAPANGATITASWTSITSTDPAQGLDYFGDGTAQSGFISGMFDKSPGGVFGHINSGCSTDEGFILQNNGGANQGYQYGAPGYSVATSWLYDTKMPNLLPGMSTNAAQIASGQYRDEGPIFFNSSDNGGKLNICDEWFQDFSTKSTFNGTISGAIFTLTSNAVGPMWEGEVIGINGVTSPTGVYITSLAGGAWGASGSTYNISNAGSVSIGSATAMHNDVFYTGPGPAFYAGTLNDLTVLNTGAAGLLGNSPHPGAGSLACRVKRGAWRRRSGG